LEVGSEYFNQTKRDLFVLRISGVFLFKSLVLAIRLFLKAQAVMKRSAKKHFIKKQDIQTLSR